ncbi:hypothetical protein CF336_g8991, partial [Tilletia laevis]
MAFDRTIETRDPHQHRSDAERFKQPFTNKEQREYHERNTGARDSPLLQLPYWQSVSRAPVDFMHCLELGLVKRLFHRVLIQGEVITAEHLRIVQHGLGTCRVPHSEQAPDRRLGDPGGGSATAAHWSTLGRRLLPLLLFVAWRPILTTNGDLEHVVTSVDKTAGVAPQPVSQRRQQGAALLPEPPPAKIKKPRKTLRHTTPMNARTVWRNVVQLAAVTTLAARRAILPNEIDKLDAILRDYGRTTADLFGARAIIYNLHLASHLPEHIRRFGPCYHFSAYHFERMNGQLGRTSTNRHRNGEIETTYTTAFITNGRFEYQLAREEIQLEASISRRMPPIKRPVLDQLTSQSLLSTIGIVEVLLSAGDAYDPPSEIYQQLCNHLHRAFSHTTLCLLPIWSSRSDGIKIMRRMRQHATLTFGHLIFGGIGVRKNASTSRTYAVVDAPDGSLDLFHIQNVLTHELHTPEQTHTSVFLLGRRAV